MAGILHNRLDHTIANLSVSAENLIAAESRIRDVDMASEMLNFTELQILRQAGTAVLAQAKVVARLTVSGLDGSGRTAQRSPQADGRFARARAVPQPPGQKLRPSLVQASAGPGAVAGIHQLRAQSLAAQHRIVSAAQASLNSPLGDRTPGRHYLVLTASRSGTAHVINLVDGPSGVATALGLLTPTGLPNTLTAAANAVFELNGLSLTRSTNRIDDALAGVTLDLRAAGPDTVRVEVIPTPEAGQTTVEGFVAAYNGALRHLRTALGRDGTLAGDVQAIRLQQRLRNIMNSAAEGDLQLWQVGITFAADRSGELVLDAGRFLDAARNNPGGVQTLLSGRALVMDDFLGAILRPGDGLVPARGRIFEEQRVSLDRELKRTEERLAAQQRLLTMQFLAMERMVSGLPRQSGALAVPLDRLMGGETGR